MHASFILPCGLAGVLIKKVLKRPLIITVHGPADFYEVPKLLNPILRFVLKRADSVVAVSSKLKNDLVNRLHYHPIKVILNGIPLEPFKTTKREIQLHDYGISSNDFVILTAGRLVQRKNIKILIRVLPAILNKIPQCKCVILGSGIEKVNLRQLIEALHLESVVIMPGWVSEEEKIAVFKRADLFIQLSQVEGLSLALLESKAAGIPAITVASTSSLSLMDPEEGKLFIQPPITIEKLIETIEYIYNKPVLRQRIGAKVKQEADKLYSLERMVERYIRLYQEILHK
jgi:glycosyltransferase involved in cell wall biosynthesis